MRLIATGRKLSTKTSLLPMGQLRTGTTIGWDLAKGMPAAMYSLAGMSF